MSSRSLLMLLLVLTCLQSFTTAQEKEQTACCLSYQRKPMPLRLIADYKETWHQCPKPGIIFILKNGRLVCADPEDQWVQKLVDEIHPAFCSVLIKP